MIHLGNALKSACVAVSFLLPMADRSDAALVSVDLLTSGDGLITRDTATNLDWLDVNAIMGLSLDAVSSSVAASAYSTVHGFGFARVSQLRSLFLDAGLVFPSSTPGGLTHEWVAPYAALASLVGATKAYPTSTNTVGYMLADDGVTFYRGMLDVYSMAGFSAVRVWEVDNPLTWQVYSPWIAQGAWLVRETPAIAAVPVPAAGGLLAAGLIGLLFGWRGRRPARN